MYKSYPRLDDVTYKTPYVPVVCKHCGSHNVIKYGKYKDVQRYYCKDCKRKFAGVDTIPKMQYPTDQIADVLNMYYEGMSLHEIRRNLIQQYKAIYLMLPL